MNNNNNFSPILKICSLQRNHNKNTSSAQLNYYKEREKKEIKMNFNNKQNIILYT